MNREEFAKLSRNEKAQYLSTALAAGGVAPALDPPAEDVRGLPKIEIEERDAGLPFEPSELQRAFLVGRGGPLEPGEASQLYQEFELVHPDLLRLEQAWNRIVQLHPALRSTFDANGRQRIHAEVPNYAIQVTRFSEDADGELESVRRELATQRLPADVWPLFCLRVSMLGERRCRVHLLVDLLIADARSIRALYEQLERAYAEPDRELRPSTLNVRDYRVALTKYEHGSPGEPSRRHWRDRLDGLAPGPMNIRQPVGRAVAPDRRRVSSVLTCWKDLQARCAALGVASNLVLLCAFASVLADWNQRNRFTLVFVCWRRPRLHPDIDSAIGDFTNLCWYEEPQERRSLLESVRRAQQWLEGELPHALISGISALRQHRLSRAGGRELAFPVVMTDTLPSSLLGRSSQLQEGYGISQTAGVWLDCINYDATDALHSHWDYDASVLSVGDTEEMFSRYVRLLGELAASDEAWQRLDVPGAHGPARAESETPSIANLGGENAAQRVTEDERYKVLYGWNSTRVDFDRKSCIHQLFERQVVRAPDAIATIYQGTTVTYATLNARANQLARYLLQSGARPGSLIGVCVERSHELIIALLGILKAGCAYVPLDAIEAQARIPAVASKAKLQYAVSNERYAQAVRPHIARIVNIDSEAAAIAAQENADLNLTQVSSEQPAYVIFTSGSTGAPKGVQVRHRPVINLIEWVGKTFGVGSNDTVLFTTSLGFDLSVFDIFGLLALGGSIHITSDTERKNAEALARILCSEAITFWDSAPATLSLVVPWLEREGAVIENDRLRLVFLSGDWIPLVLPDQVRKQFPGANVISLGGATEATVWSNYYPVGAIQPEWRSIPYGRPIQNARYYILSQDLEPVPVGVEGDLYIAGECLSDGYLNDPELTARAFIPDPFVSEESALMYRTGDRARFFPDGNIEFLGRSDFQVKVRGFRVELGEIEHRLRSHPGIREALVVVRQVASGDQMLVAYVIAEAGQSPSSRELRGHARETLPEYMVPNVIVPLSAFPVTANGKVDRAALPWPPSGNELASAPVEVVAARVPAVLPMPAAAVSPKREWAPAELASIEATLAAWLRDQLACTSVGGDDDLFDLGATSLTVTRLVGYLAERYGVQVPLETVLEEPTLRAIARHLGPAPQAPSKVAVRAFEADGLLAELGALIAGELPAPPSGVDADLFDCGATSLTIMRITAAIAARYGVTLSVERVLENPSIRAIADAVGESASLPRPTGLPVAALSELLSVLRSIGRDAPRQHLYPSAGSIYSTQVYLSVGADSIAGLPGGAYYYHPIEHALWKLTPGEMAARGVGSLPDVRAHAGLLVFLVADLAALRAIYAGLAERLALLDSGYVAELLLRESARLGLGLQSVPDLDFERSRGAFQLGPDHLLCTCLADATAAASHPRSGGARFGATRTLAAAPDHEGLRTEAPFTFLALDEQRRIKKELPTLRSLSPGAVTPLARTGELDGHRHARRATRREYLSRTVLRAELGALLEGLNVPRGLGVYVIVRGGAVAGLSAATYRLDSAAGILVPGGPDAWLRAKRCHLPFNRRIHELAAFEILVFAEPVPGEDGVDIRHAFVEAGRLGQMLMERQADYRLGLCPIGGLIGVEGLKRELGIPQASTFLHSWTGGAFDLAKSARAERSARNLEPSSARPVASGVAAYIPSRNENVAVERGPAAGEIAVVGMACRFPDANDPEEYWSNLARGWCSFGSLPVGRRRELATRSGLQGAFLQDISSFDHAAFKLSPAEARTMDPQERLFLEIAWECLENAACAKATGAGERVGVFVGAMWSDYQAPDSGSAALLARPTSLHSAIANRVSHFFDLKGPSVAIDTSCASGLTALHLACASLERGDCDAALVGAVNLVARRRHFELLEALNLLSEDGRCAAFAADANGWVVGEGVAAVLLRPLASAERRADHVHALIRATAVGHTGRTRRYSMPSASALGDGLRALLQRGAVPAESINYVECAAAGASLADAAEVSALAGVFGERSNGAMLAIGSVKPNVGHLESAASISQLIKVIKQLEHGKLAPTLLSGDVNPLLQLDANGLMLNRELRVWPAASGGMRRRALITSIGGSGSFGHLVLEEAPERFRRPTENNQPVIVPVSASNALQLEELLAKLEQHLGTPRGAALSVRDVAHSLAVGRFGLPHRFAAVVTSTDELRDKIAAFLSTGDIDGVYHGRVAVEPGQERPAPLGSSLDRLAEGWVTGHVDLPEVADGRRVPLPTYAWSRSKHWVGELESSEPITAPETSPRPDGASSLRAAATRTPAVDLAPAVPRVNRRAVQNYLRALFAEVAAMRAEEVDAEALLEDYGLTSLMIQALNGRLARDLGSVPQTLFFEHRRLSEVADALLASHAPRLARFLQADSEARPEARAAVARVVSASSRREERAGFSGEDIAIIGMVGRYPKADDVARFWENLRDGVDCIGEIPAERWDAERNFARNVRAPGLSYCKWGGFLKDCESFDALFFGVSPKEAAITDPQERLFLELSWELFEDAGYSLEQLARTYDGEVGVFVGVMYGEYQFFGIESALQGKPVAMHSVHGSVANRVSYFYDFKGPSMAIDTLCSSSLTALHQAALSIKNGDCRAAVVGGVNLSLHPNKYLAISQLQMASASGRCRPFSKHADGFVPGEGAGAILLKPLGDAQRDGDRILAVIKATSVNHGGRTHAYTVPSPTRQAQLIETSLRKAGLEPAQVGYVEAHGTGTVLGDPIEIAALNKAFASAASGPTCAIGSVKSNIGHLEAAAGIAGLTKCVLQLQHRQLVPSLHVAELNPHVDFDGGRFRVQAALEPWHAPAPVDAPGSGAEPKRVASVCAFGAGGANGHVILEEYVAPAREDLDGLLEPQVILLSARTRGQVVTCVQRLRDWLRARRAEERSQSHLLLDLAYTTQVGRTAMKERVAIVAHSVDDLEQKLDRLESDGSAAEGIYRCAEAERGSYAALLSGDDGAAMLSSLLERRSIDKLATLWVTGVDVPWAGLERPWAPQRISLPTYPFQKERYWIEQAGALRAHAAPKVAVAEGGSLDASTLLLSPSWQEAKLPPAEDGPWGAPVVFGASPSLLEGLRSCLPEGALAWANDDVSLDEIESSAVIQATEQKGYAAFFARSVARGVTRLDLIYAYPAARAGKTLRASLADGIYRLTPLLRAWAAIPHPIALRVLCPYPEAEGECLDVRALGGFFRSAVQEYSRLEFKLLELPGDSLENAASMRIIADELREAVWASGEVRHLEGRRLVRQYGELPSADGRAAPRRQRGFESSGVYLITGGSGRIGQLLARHIAGCVRSTLLLVGSSPLSDEAVANMRAIEALGSHPVYHRVDLSDADRVQALLSELRTAHGAITGVIHAAGSLADSLISNKREEDIDRVLSPKLFGLVAVDRALRDEALEFFVIFSSLVGSIGNAGQSDYAFANAYADEFAERRAELVRRGERHGQTLSIAWPYWRDGGMSMQPDAIERMASQTGLEPLPTRAAWDVLDRLLAGAPEQCRVIVAHGREPKLTEFLAKRLPGMAPSPAAATQSHARPSEAPVIGTASERLIEFLVARLARETGARPDQIAADLEFPSLGVTSIMIASIIEDIDEACGVKLYVNELQVHDTAHKLSAHVQRELERQNRSVPATLPSVHLSEQPAASTPRIATEGLDPAAGRPARTTGIKAMLEARQGPARLPVVFLLSAPRSGSTLLRVMLMGHSQLFAPPELHLLGFESMRQRSAALASKNQKFLGEGLIESIRALNQSDAASAEAEVQGLEAADLSIGDVYDYLARRCSPRRLVDKSPTYGLELDALNQAQELCPNAFYLFLKRHPVSMMESFVRNRFAQMLGMLGDPWSLAEELWREMNGNIQRFLADVPSSRQHSLRYEDLVLDPEGTMRGVCSAMGIGYESALLDPYGGDRLTRGLHAQSTSIGDPAFLNHDRIEPELAWSWKKHLAERGALQPTTIDLAEALGYPRAELVSNAITSDQVAE